MTNLSPIQQRFLDYLDLVIAELDSTDYRDKLLDAGISIDLSVNFTASAIAICFQADAEVKDAAAHVYSTGIELARDCTIARQLLDAPISGGIN